MYPEEKISYIFYGDGPSDRENQSNSATTEVVIKYINYLEEQRKIAEEYLELIKKDPT